MKIEILRRQSLLKKLVISYILVLIIPLLIGSYVYKEAVKTVGEEAIRNNYSLLEQTKQMMDIRLDEVDAISTQLSLDDKLITLMNIKQIESGSKDYYKIYDYVSKTSKYNLTNNFIEDYFIYFKDNQWIVSSDRAYPNFSTFYPHAFSMPNLNASEFTSMIWNNKLQYYLGGGVSRRSAQEQQVILFVRPVMLHYFGQPQGVVFVLLKESEIKNMLGRIDTSGKGLVYVMDENNHLISQAGGATLSPAELDRRQTDTIYFRSSQGESFIVSETVSSRNNWRYVSAIPREYVLSKVSYIRSITLAVMFITLVLGAIVASVLAYRNAKPLREILKNIADFFEGDSMKERDEYGYINNRILDLIQYNKLMKEDMDKQIPFLRVSFYRRLLYGELVSKKEVDTHLQHIRLEIEGKRFAAIILRFEEFTASVNEHVLKESEVIKALIRNQLLEGPANVSLIYDLDASSLAVVISIHDSDAKEASIRKEASILYDYLSESLDIRLFFAVGGVYDGLHNVSRSFEEACQALEYARYGASSKILYGNEIPKDNNHIYYPIELELKLIGHIKSGDAKEVERIADKLYEENIMIRDLSPPLIDQWFHLLVGTLARTSARAESIASLTQLELLQKIQEFSRVTDKFNWIKDALLACANALNAQRHQANQQLIEDVKRYIEEHYAREDFTLYQTASYFEITEAQLYTLIKEHTGMTFAEMLEKQRIERACSLLIAAESPIKEIALDVGYASDHSFRRAFKRVMGVLPTEYAKALK